MAVLRASLSHKGYEIARDVMQLNRFLGDLVGGPAVLGEWAYTFCLFGAPSDSEPWGWQLFGHHLSLNCFVIGRQMVLTPCFLGAEPNYADTGPFAGTRLFEDEERAGLALMRSLSASQQQRAIVAHAMVGGDLPPGRRHFADNLHLGGAFQDNRIVPYEGLRASALSAQQQRDLMDLVEAYIAPLPPGPLAARLAEVERHLADTHFCWIGGFAEDQPLLLPDSEPGDLHRVRSPRRRFPDQRRAGEVPRPHHRAHAERQRLRHRPAAPALPAGGAPPARVAGFRDRPWLTRSNRWSVVRRAPARNFSADRRAGRSLVWCSTQASTPAKITKAATMAATITASSADMTSLRLCHSAVARRAEL